MYQIYIKQHLLIQLAPVQQFLKAFQERLDQFKPNTALLVLAPHMASELLEHLFSKKLRDYEW